MAGLASVTVARGAERTDVAVAEGTTVSGLLAALQIDVDPRRASITTADGRPAQPDMVIGEDLPAGTLLAITQGTGQREGRKSAQAESERWYTPTAMVVGTMLVAAAAELILLWLPFFFTPARWLDSPARAGVAAAIAALLATLAARSRWVRAAAGAVFTPGLAGGLAAAFIAPDDPIGVPLAVGISAVAAFVIALVLRLWHPSGTATLAAGFWAVLAVVTCTAVLAQAAFPTIAPLLLAAGVVMVAVVPPFAVRVPDHDVVDLPALTSDAPARGAEILPADKITWAEVTRLVADGRGIVDVIAWGGIGIAAAMAFPTAQRIMISDQDGLMRTLEFAGTIAVLACSVVVLVLIPAMSRSRTVGILARSGSAAVLASTLAACVVFSADKASALFLAVAVLVGAGLAVVFGMAAASRKESTPRLGRIADIFRGLAVFFAVPSAILASGLFDIIWKAAS
ncbi:MAG: hypothetical protein LBR58_04165 [Propionibacteriaceae bacterium]|jgi:hypothetical protein|nr:hypothetical protein [Propionibacteriaceae bacterium]